MGDMTRGSVPSVAFLRAINVGGHVVKMDRLRALFVAMGFADAKTFIASGNVIFTAPAGEGAALEGMIEQHLLGELGYDVAVFLRSFAELREIASLRPYGQDGAAAEGTLYAGFLKNEPDETARQKLIALESPTDRLAAVGREVYWYRRTSMHISRISGAVLERALGMTMTMRNISTVRRLVGWNM